MLKICLIFMYSLFFLIIKNNLGAEIISIETTAVTRTFFGSVDNSTKHDFSLALAVEQNYLFNFKNELGTVLTGIDYNYFKMKNNYSSMRFDQIGLLGSFYFDNNFGVNKLKNEKIIPFVRVHTGYVKTKLDSDSMNVDKSNKHHLFAGAGLGLGYKIFKNIFFKTFYLGDVHFLQNGRIYIHSINTSISLSF